MKPKTLTRLANALCVAILVAAALEILLIVSNRTGGVPDLQLSGNIYFAIFPVAYALLAALIVNHQPHNSVGWLLFGPGIFSISQIFANLYPQAVPAPATSGNIPWLIAWFFSWSWMLFIFPIFIIPILFPTGRPISSRWSWLIYLALGMFGLLVFTATFAQTLDFGEGGSVTNPIGFLTSQWWEFWQIPWNIGLLVLTLSSAASIFVRFRRADAVEREQIKWLLYACGIFVLVYIPSNIWSDAAGPLQDFLSLIFPLTLVIIPLAIAIAILRYRLWDIDLIIRRTLVYGALTALLGLVYFGAVVVLQQVFGKITGQENSPLAIVLSTLAIAALFNPLRYRLQALIDRRFYRRKYNAERALVSFARTAKGEVAIERLSIELLETIKNTLQPERVNLWLNPTLQKKNFENQELDAH